MTTNRPSRIPMPHRWAAAILVIAVSAAAYAELAPTQQLSGLAEDGRFDELLIRLGEHDAGTADGTLVANLIGDIERYQSCAAERDAKRQREHEEALAKIDTFLRDGRFRIEAEPAEDQTDEDQPKDRWGTLEDALAVAIDAHGLTDDPDALLRDERVMLLVARMDAAAQQAEDNEDWVEALSIYRLLNLLYEETNGYREQVKRVARHVRVLQLYAPDELERLYTARAERRARDRGLDEPEPINLEVDSWTDRLKNIQLPMLRQTLRQAALGHVENEGYLQLVAGGVDNMLVLVNTPALAQTFPTLGDAEKLNAFRDHLNRLSAMLQVPGKTINFLETWTIIERILRTNDVTVELPEAVIVYELTEGATDSLDEFTSVIWPEDLGHFSRSTEGNFKGVGIQITKKQDQLLVVTPLEGTPAHRAGIRANDVIAKVNGVDTRSWSLNKAVSKITGPEGTDVVLEIERPGVEQPISMTITRANIEIESIRGWEHRDRVSGDGWDYWIDPQARIGYVRLSQFIPKSASDLDEAIAQMQADGPINGLILDLRFNPGGLLKSAVEMSDRFIDEGPIVFTVNQDGEREITETAHGDVTYRPFPVVVLINQGSASASEIVAGALQDYDRALIIGTRSFGKGSVQDLFKLGSGEAYLKLTTQYYMLPLERIIHRKPEATQWGIEPDLVIEMTNQEVADAIELRQEVDILRVDAELNAEDAEPQATADAILEQGLDPQLEAALLVLKAQSVARHIAIAQRDVSEQLVETP